MLAHPLNLQAEVGAVLEQSADAERAGFVDLPGIASQAFRWPQVIDRATVYRARIGQRRAYFTPADALAYETGFSHPAIGWTPGTPAADGAADRKAQS